jgi:hypothetical protein
MTLTILSAKFGSGLSQAQGDSPANALASAGDDSHLAKQIIPSLYLSPPI